MNKAAAYGYRHWYEVYLQKSTLDGEMWDITLRSLLQHVGLLNSVMVAMSVEENMVRYFVGANKNLAELSNALEKVSFRPIKPSMVVIPRPTRAERLVMFVPGGNIIDLRERMSVNRHLALGWAIFKLRAIGPSQVYCAADLLFRRPSGEWSISHKQLFTLPGRLVAVNFRENEKYGYQKFSQHLDIKKTLHILRSQSNEALMEVETYPYLQQNAYLDLTSYDFDKHSFIIGASGSGKSKFIGLFVDRLLRSPMAGNYRVVVIDPHASLEHDLQSVPGASIVKFSSRDDSTELFSAEATDIAASTELTSSLFRSLLGDAYTPQLDRTLRYGLTALMTAQVMSLSALKRFLMEENYRLKIITHVEEYIPHNIAYFFREEYPKITRDHYADTVLPIVELVDEIELQAGGVGMRAQASSLATVVSANPLTVFSLNKVAMGEKVIKTVSGLLIQQLFLLAQARQFEERIILIIDEVSVIQNPTISQILAEARKYNLFVFLSQQYFGQIDKQLQNAIFSNVSNYYVFKVSEVDGRALEGNITMELPRKMTMEATRIINNQEDLRVPILTSLDSRECIVRVSGGGKILPAFKARTLEFTPEVEAIHEALRLQNYARQTLPDKFDEDHDPDPQPSTSHHPESSQVVTPNLMEVLARSSSHRNKKGKTL